MFEEQDIVQIVDEKHPWYPALLIVSEVKTWGVQAYCLIPQSNVENQTVQAYNRIKNEQVAKVGKAVVVSASAGEKE